MADANKAQQFLAARKKLKEYQKIKKSKNSEKQFFSVDRKTPAESLTNSTHSSLNEAVTHTTHELRNPSASPLQNYFSAENHSNQSQPEYFFDNLDSTNYNNGANFAYNYPYYAGALNHNQILDRSSQQNEHVATVNDVFQEANALNSNVRRSTPPNVEPNVANAENVRQPVGTISDNNLTRATPEENQPRKSAPSDLSLLKHDSLESNSTDTESSVKHHSFEESVKDQHGSMETLKQLSTQIIQLIDDNSPIHSHEHAGADLDSKNVELAALLQKERGRNDELRTQLQQCRDRIALLETSAQSGAADVQNRHLQEVTQLKEQVEYYQQTVNILVSEKSEMSNLLSQNESAMKQKTVECEELNARLKTSRSRVADLEKDLNGLRAEKSTSDRRGLEQDQEYVKFMDEHRALKDQVAEAHQDTSELQEKLNASAVENLQLQREVQDLTSQLSLLNVKVQQLSIDESAQSSGEIDRLRLEKQSLEKQVSDLNAAVGLLTNERDQASVQYQQYVQQLNGQLATLAQKLEAQVEEKESLVLREQQLINQMGELEKLLQRYQNEALPQSNNGGKKLEEALSAMQILNDEKVALDERYDSVVGERDELCKELEAKKDDIVQLEELVQQLQSDQPDSAKLLATMESDKVAAARAVSQNAELKKQLEEMQDVFIKMSNDKLELTERLNGEQHKNKDLRDKLGHFESQIYTLTDAIEIKDRELINVRESAVELNKHVLQQNQLEDRLRHYEAHDYSTHALQTELQDSYKRVQTLKGENERLTRELESTRQALEGANERLTRELESAKQTKESAPEGSTTVNNNTLPGGEGVHVLAKKVAELEALNKEMGERLRHLQAANSSLEVEIGECKGSAVLSKEAAMRQLEDKFTSTMKEIAELEDEKQKLEHLVMQLQSETETIGEYVTLYQHQRGVLKQRALEREEQMKQLTLDREHMKAKLDKLNRLIKTLFVDEGSIPPEFLQQQAVGKHALCTEHAKIHESMANVARENGGPPGNESENKTETAGKIIELLSEIKYSNLVQPSDTTETFHPCPWCSGQLITV